LLLFRLSCWTNSPKNESRHNKRNEISTRNRQSTHRNYSSSFCIWKPFVWELSHHVVVKRLCQTNYGLTYQYRPELAIYYSIHPYTTSDNHHDWSDPKHCLRSPSLIHPHTYESHRNKCCSKNDPGHVYH
jgi:hypothetical protein